MLGSSSSRFALSEIRERCTFYVSSELHSSGVSYAFASFKRRERCIVEVSPEMRRAGELVRRKRYYPPLAKNWIARAAQEGIVYIESESSFDVVVVGGGIAGCCAAIEAARRRRFVCLARVRRASFPARVSIQERGGLGLSDLATRSISTIWSRQFARRPRRCQCGARRLVRAGVFPRLSPRLKRWAFL